MIASWDWRWSSVSVTMPLISPTIHTFTISQAKTPTLSTAIRSSATSPTAQGNHPLQSSGCHSQARYVHSHSRSIPEGILQNSRCNPDLSRNVSIHSAARSMQILLPHLPHTLNGLRITFLRRSHLPPKISPAQASTAAHVGTNAVPLPHQSSDV